MKNTDKVTLTIGQLKRLIKESTRKTLRAEIFEYAEKWIKNAYLDNKPGYDVYNIIDVAHDWKKPRYGEVAYGILTDFGNEISNKTKEILQKVLRQDKTAIRLLEDAIINASRLVSNYIT